MKIQLDIPYIVDLPDNSIEPISGIEYSVQFAAKHGVLSTVIAEHGPAGGNPLIEFEGPEENLKALIREYDGDNGDYEMLLEHITE